MWVLNRNKTIYTCSLEIRFVILAISVPLFAGILSKTKCKQKRRTELGNGEICDCYFGHLRVN